MRSADLKILLSIVIGIVLMMAIVGVILFQPWTGSSQKQDQDTSAQNQDANTEPTDTDDQTRLCTDSICDTLCKQKGHVTGIKLHYDNDSACSVYNRRYYPDTEENTLCSKGVCCCTTEFTSEIDKIGQQCASQCQAIASASSSREELRAVWDYCTMEFSAPVSDKIQSNYSSDVVVAGVGGAKSFCRKEAHCFNLYSYIDSCQYKGKVLDADTCLKSMCAYQLTQGKTVAEAEERIRQTMVPDTCTLKKGVTSNVLSGRSANLPGHYMKIRVKPNLNQEFATPDCSEVSAK